MKLRIINAQKLKVQLQWEPRDLWVGLFWRVNREMPSPYYTLHLYICIVPLIPLHATIMLRDGPEPKRCIHGTIVGHCPDCD